MQPTVTVTFPAPLPAEIPCPICEGNKCKVCDMTGKLQLTVDAKVPIQRAHIVKFVAENMSSMSTLLNSQYGLSPEIETEEMLQYKGGVYEVVRVSSLGGAMWMVHRVDKLESPRYFKSYKELKTFKGGLAYEE